MDNNDKLSQRDKIQALYTAIVGIPNTDEKGLVGDVKDALDKLTKLEYKYNKLNRNFWILVGILSGSGILGANLSGLLGG